MKILYVACGNGNSSAVAGGSIRIIEIANRINKKGNEVCFLTSSGGKKVFKNYFLSNSIFEIKSYLIKYPVKFRNSYFEVLKGCLILTLKSFFNIKKLPEVDLIYATSDGFWDIIPVLLYKRKFPKAKWISISHHKVTLRQENIQSFFVSLINIILQKFSYFFICKYSDVIFILDTDAGDKIKNFFRKKGYKKQIYSVKDGVNTKQIKRVPEQKKKYDACFLGGLRPSKGLYDIVPIWKKVCEKNANARLVIIGNMMEKYKNYLKKEIKNNNLENDVIIKGFIADKIEVIKLIKQSKIFISPSHEEGWGMAIMEYLAAGLPGVLWDLPVYKRIFKNGIIKVKLFNIDLFAEKVCQLFDDEKLFDDLKSQTLAEVKKYDWDNIAQQELMIFNKIL